MIHKILLLILFILFLAGETKAQKADLSSIKQIIEEKFWVDLETLDVCETVILNGIPFKKTEINTELGKFKLKEVIVTELVDLSGSRFIHKNCGYIILLGTGYHQSKKDKGRLLDSIRINLNANLPKLRIHDYVCSQCKQVIIEGQPINMYEAQRIVNELKGKDIKYIASYKSANPKIYGQYAKNGLIEIYLTDKGKRKNSRKQ